MNMKSEPTVGKLETVNKYTPETISAGASYACLYSTHIQLTEDGRIPEPGETADRSEPLTGFAVIHQRDLKNRRLTVLDVNLAIELVVDVDDVWDIDEAVFQDA